MPDKLRVLAKYKMLIIDEIGCLPMDVQGALFFQLIARRYEKTSTVFTSNKTFSQWNEVFADVTIASAPGVFLQYGWFSADLKAGLHGG